MCFKFLSQIWFLKWLDINYDLFLNIFFYIKFYKAFK